MKKFILGLMAIGILTVTFTSPVYAITPPTTEAVVPAPKEDLLEAEALMARLGEIRAMDLAGLAKAEKKQLRNEVKAIKQDLRKASQGVYLSIGAILIIILLLILVL